jgi:hypothetical protein
MVDLEGIDHFVPGSGALQFLNPAPTDHFSGFTMFNGQWSESTLRSARDYSAQRIAGFSAVARASRISG